MKTLSLYPVILAAGPSIRQFFPPSGIVRAENQNPFETAATNCEQQRGLLLPSPIFVLGCDSARVSRHVPATATLVINRNWRAGQWSSLMAGLRCVPRSAAFMLYPVDLVHLTPTVIGQIVSGFLCRARGTEIVMPSYRGRGGHPAIFSAKLRDELRRAMTAREVVYHDMRRIAFVPVRSSAICKESSKNSDLAWKDSELQIHLGNSRT